MSCRNRKGSDLLGYGESTLQPFDVRQKSEQDEAWVADLLREHWGSTKIITRGVVHDADKLPALVAWFGEERVGLVTYRIDGNQCEVVSLNSLQESNGVGSILLNAVKEVAVKAGCKRIWLITTNDNLAAVRFYQKRGYSLVTVHRNAIAESRKLKPTIPENGIDGIPIRDEIELEMVL